MRLVFLGSPEFALPSLKALYDSHHKILAVISQPDKPRGRKQIITPTPVKEFAISKGLKILTPQNLNDENFIKEYEALEPKINVVVAYGRLMPGWLINYPQHGSVNAHASLLPRWRGAAPITRSIMAGDDETGITTQQVVKELDAGGIILQEKIPITLEDNYQTLSDKLAYLSAKMLLKTLDLIKNGQLPKRKQDESAVTYAEKITKEDQKINFSEKAEINFNKIRALSPKPGAYAFLKDKRLKILKAQVSMVNAKPGEIKGISKEGILTGTAEKGLLLKDVQAQGGKVMGAFEFAKGARIKEGESFN